jgi:hypothetical protein
MHRPRGLLRETARMLGEKSNLGARNFVVVMEFDNLHGIRARNLRASDWTNLVGE